MKTNKKMHALLGFITCLTLIISINALIIKTDFQVDIAGYFATEYLPVDAYEASTAAVTAGAIAGEYAGKEIGVVIGSCFGPAGAVIGSLGGRIVGRNVANNIT